VALAALVVLVGWLKLTVVLVDGVVTVGTMVSRISQMVDRVGLAVMLTRHMVGLVGLVEKAVLVEFLRVMAQLQWLPQH